MANKNKKQTKTLKGKGQYTTTFGKPPPRPQPKKSGSLGRQLISGAGSTIGAYLGGPLGGMVGGFLGDTASTLMGLGKYKLRKNSLTRYHDQIPNMHSGDQTVVIRKKEYIGDVTTSATVGAFQATSYAINPANNALFPWLSGISANYQEWTPRGMAVYFESMSGDSVGSTTTTLAEVMITTQYRSSASAPLNENDMLNEEYSSHQKASKDQIHMIECDPKQNPFNVLYVRPGGTIATGSSIGTSLSALPTGDTPNMYDIGQVTVATVGSQAASVLVGKIWMVYEVELRKPWNGVARGIANLTTVYALSTCTTGNLFGTSTVASGYNGCNVVVPNSGNILTWDIGSEGTYFVTINWNSTTANTATTLGTLVNCTTPILFKSNTATVLNSGATANGLGGASSFYVTITNPQLAASLTLTSTLTGASGGDLIITQVNPTITSGFTI
jgi:hypothetical protein